MHAISRSTLWLTLGYFCLWCAGPLLLQSQGNWLGLPIWFWFSCLFAPVLLIISLIFTIKATPND